MRYPHALARYIQRSHGDTTATASSQSSGAARLADLCQGQPTTLGSGEHGLWSMQACTLRHGVHTGWVAPYHAAAMHHHTRILERAVPGLHQRCPSLGALKRVVWQQPFNDTVSEWLRRWTRNPLGSARKGSNPFGVDRRLGRGVWVQVCVACALCIGLTMLDVDGGGGRTHIRGSLLLAGPPTAGGWLPHFMHKLDLFPQRRTLCDQRAARVEKQAMRCPHRLARYIQRSHGDTTAMASSQSSGAARLVDLSQGPSAILGSGEHGLWSMHACTVQLVAHSVVAHMCGPDPFLVSGKTGSLQPQTWQAQCLAVCLMHARPAVRTMPQNIICSCL